MRIVITSGSGEGETRIAAFDRALWNAGIANYNLIKLSSVIPENAEVVFEKVNWNSKEIGNKLYVVLSESYESTPGKKAVAGLGWVLSNGGIFVEHNGSSREYVTEQIKKSINSMSKYRQEKGEINMEFAEKECQKDTACTIVAAIYKSEGW